MATTLSNPAVPSGEPRTRHLGGGHLVPLDGVRGLAILVVMASHLFAVNYQEQGRVVRVIGQAIYYGWMGVDLFFVLSGFLITGILVDSREQAGYFKNFYMRRVLRIFPLYYGVLFGLLLLTPVLHIVWHGIFPALLLYGQNLYRYNQYTSQVGPDVSLNHLWSLAVEEQFYLIWPFLVFFARTRQRVLIAALAGSVCAMLYRFTLITVWHNLYTTHHSMFARADALLLGSALAMLYRSSYWPAVLRWAPLLTCLTAGIVIATLIFGAPEQQQWPHWTQNLRYTVTALASCGLVAWVLRPGLVASAFSLRALRFFGKYSYGLYILHMVVLPLQVRVFRAGLYRLYPSKGLAVVGQSLIVTVLAIAAAFLSFQFYEKPFLRLKRYFDYPARARPVS